ncbi:MAG: metallophosphoesterase [Proteobacteria bacterium]|nr:metallophosphoesterase [Pseudomonadota bacterium]
MHRALPLIPAVAVLLAASSLYAEPFVFVALPDTQKYTENRFPGDGRFPAVTDPRGTGAIFFDQTEWIVDKAAKHRIRYVSHLGDIVEHGDDLTEWARAKDAMDLLLRADIPHGTIMGNHDDNHGPDYRRNYLDHFGPQVFAGRSWYRSSSPGGGGSFQLLEHEGLKLGFLNFSIDHPQPEIDWANQVIADNPDTIFIIGTHRYLYDFKLFGGRYGEEVETPLGPLTVQDNFVDGVVEPNTAQELFNELVTQHPNILMIHAGHFHADWLRLDGVNSNAQTIIQILTDYQNGRNGGDGWLRIYELDFDEGTFRFDTYSPTLDRRRTTIDHYVETIHLAYEQRDNIIEVLGIDEEAYFLLLGLLFKQTPAPDGFLLQHPDFDEPEERAYYERYLSELFLGDIPEGFEDILEWEGLWLLAFAADILDPFDFSDSARSPRGSLEIDYSAYFTPLPQQAARTALLELIEAIQNLAARDFPFSSAREVLTHGVESTLKRVEQGRTAAAPRRFRRRVRRHLDGCAKRDAPDSTWPGFDLVDNCAAQQRVYPLVIEANRLLNALIEPR